MFYLIPFGALYGIHRNPLLILKIKGLAQVSRAKTSDEAHFLSWFRDCSLVIRFYKFPNIGSELDSYTGDGSGSFRRGTGAIALMSKMTLGYEPGTATLNNAWRTAAFSAQRSNSAYGNAETVQPLSLRVLALIRAF